MLIIEMPKLSNESAAMIRNFLESLLYSFEAHYFIQIREYYRSLSPNDDIEL
jgi:recombinational DNA repair ATPase RecF